jgi:hypothetical protein
MKPTGDRANAMPCHAIPHIMSIRLSPTQSCNAETRPNPPKCSKSTRSRKEEKGKNIVDLDKNVKFGQICRGKHASRRNADEYASQSCIAVTAGWNPAQLPWAVSRGQACCLKPSVVNSNEGGLSNGVAYSPQWELYHRCM